MKNHSSNHQTGRATKRRLIAGSLFVICSVAITVAQLWTPAEYLAETSIHLPPSQILRFPDLGDTQAFEWAAFSIQDPAKANEMIQALKSPQDKILDEWKKLSVLNPDGYRESWNKTFGPAPWDEPEMQAQREEAHHAILNPRETAAERESWMSADERTRVEVARFSILHPDEFNQLVQPFKSRATLDQEAIALSALEQPEAFTAELRHAWEATQDRDDTASQKQDGGANE